MFSKRTNQVRNQVIQIVIDYFLCGNVDSNIKPTAKRIYKRIVVFRLQSQNIRNNLSLTANIIKRTFKNYILNIFLFHEEKILKMLILVLRFPVLVLLVCYFLAHESFWLAIALHCCFNILFGHEAIIVVTQNNILGLCFCKNTVEQNVSFIFF